MSLTGRQLVPVDVRRGRRSRTAWHDALIEVLLARIVWTWILLARPPHVLLADGSCGRRCWTIIILRLRPILWCHVLLRGARRWLRVDREQTTGSSGHAHPSGGVRSLISLTRSVPVRGLFNGPHRLVLRRVAGHLVVLRKLLYLP